MTKNASSLVSLAFDDAVKRIEFYVRVEGKFPKYIMTKGQKIAEMGDTDANAVKLHFEQY